MVYPMHESKMKGFDEQRNKNSFTASIAHVVQKATKGGGDHDGGRRRRKPNDHRHRHYRISHDFLEIRNTEKGDDVYIWALRPM